VIGRLTPTIAAIWPAHIPAASITTSVRIAPWSVSTAATSPRAFRTIPVTRTPVEISTPSRRACAASSIVAPLGSSQPSPGRYIAPCRLSPDINGKIRSDSAGEIVSTSRPIARAIPT
jgi:hypothetical protein